MSISFFFRKPKFPIICDIDGHVIAAKTKVGLEKQLYVHEYPKDSSYNVIDISGEGWALNPELMVISPVTLKKNWSKKEVIAIYNNRKNDVSNVAYSPKSISAKRFEQIVLEIVELLLKER